MEKWIPCGDKFITGDVIRWVEPVWKPKQKKTERGEKIGYRLVIDQEAARQAQRRQQHAQSQTDPHMNGEKRAAEGGKTHDVFYVSAQRRTRL